MNNGNGVVMTTQQERLQQRLSNPETTEALIKLLDKLDLILLTVDSIDGFLSRGDQIIENISDSVHDVRKMAPAANIDVEKTATAVSESLPVLVDALPRLTHSLPRLLALAEKLDDPAKAEALDQIMDKMELIALTLESADGFLKRSDTVIENVAGSVQDVRNMAPAGNIDVEKTVSVMTESLPVLLDALPRLTHSLPRLLALAEKLDDPAKAEALDQIIDKMELVALTLESADGFLKRSDTVIENIADSVNDVRKLAPADELNLWGTVAQTLPQLAASLPQLVALLPSMTRVVPQLQAVLDSDEFDALMTSGVFSPKTVGIVSEAGNALVNSYETNQVQPQSIGFFGLLRAMQDPDVQRALGFFMEFSKRFGQAINK